MASYNKVPFFSALWFHNTLALDPNVAVNVFWRHLNRDCYDTKDIYGNKDLNQASRALNLLDKAIKLIEELPDDYRDFYARRMIGKLQNKALL